MTNVQDLQSAVFEDFFTQLPLMHLCFDDEGRILIASDFMLDVLARAFNTDNPKDINILTCRPWFETLRVCVNQHRPGHVVMYVNRATGDVTTTFNVRHSTDYVCYAVSYMPVLDRAKKFASNYISLRNITEWYSSYMLNRLAADKLDLLTRQLGLAHFNYSPKEDAFDIFGGRDSHWALGASSEEVMKGIVHPDDRERMEEVLKVMRDEEHRSVRFSARMISYALHCYRTFNCEFIPQFFDNGEFAFYAGYGIDVTDHVDAIRDQKEQMRLQTDLLQDKIEMLQTGKQLAELKEKGMGDLLSCMGHDLRSPLATIEGFTELMAFTDNTDEKAEYYKIVKGSVQQMTMLVNDILVANRIETGRMKYDIQPMDVGELLYDLYQTFKLRFDQLPVKLELTPLKQPLVIQSDMQRVIEVLSNYICNAIKYTSEGSVRLWHEEADGGVYLHVTDTGRGIAPENHEKVFNRFEMLGSELKGNGLGLYICREIANGLGGRVGLNSQLGEGSDFWLWLPMATRN